MSCYIHLSGDINLVMGEAISRAANSRGEFESADYLLLWVDYINPFLRGIEGHHSANSVVAAGAASFG